MSNAALTATGTAILSLFTSILSAGPLPGFSLAAQTTHFSFYSRGEKVDAEKNEKFLATVEAELGHDFTGKASYYRYQTPEQVAMATGAYAQGVTLGKRKEIHSTQDFHAHEIVHLVADQLGDPGALFHEGLAVAMGNEGRWLGKDVDKAAKSVVKKLGWQAIVDRFDAIDANQSYAAAGSFVRALIRTHGMAKVTEFFRSCPKPQQRDAAFASTFGVSLEEAATQWAANL